MVDRDPSFLCPREPSVDRRYRPRPKRQVNLFSSICEDEESCDDMETGSVSSATSVQGDAALVYLRLRPVNNKVIGPNYQIKENVLVTSKPELNAKAKTIQEKHFSFTDIFDSSVAQSHIYDACVREIIEAEENFTVMTYGTSGSGKTYTLLGHLDNPGIIPRALENIFKLYENNIYSAPAVKLINSKIVPIDDDEIAKEEKFTEKILSLSPNVENIFSQIQNSIASHKFKNKNFPKTSLFIWISFVEIYNEVVYDLLSPTFETNLRKKKRLKILTNNGKAFIKNVTTVYVKSSLEAYKILSLGLKRVTYASTIINNHSSRSHCIFSVDILRFSPPDIFTNHTIKFCDLAGSERVQKTQNTGSRLNEAKSINTSLMVLGRCLDSVYTNQQKKRFEIVPFRDSKLTMLLQASLVGKEKITMIVNITPNEEYFEENLNALGFASIAKNIIYKPSININKTRYSLLTSNITESSSILLGKHYNESLLEENIMLKAEIENLSQEIINLEKLLLNQEAQIREKLVDEFQKTLSMRNEIWEKRLAQEKRSIEIICEAKIKVIEESYKKKLKEKYEEVEVINSDSENEFMNIQTENN